MTRGRLYLSDGYKQRSAAVRAAAYADPGTRCRRCLMTLAEFMLAHPGRSAKWQAGHIVDGDNAAGLSPEHAYCNTAAGARTRNGAAGMNRSERWY